MPLNFAEKMSKDIKNSSRKINAGLLTLPLSEVIVFIKSIPNLSLHVLCMWFLTKRFVTLPINLTASVRKLEKINFDLCLPALSNHSLTCYRKKKLLNLPRMRAMDYIRKTWFSFHFLQVKSVLMVMIKKMIKEAMRGFM